MASTVEIVIKTTKQGKGAEDTAKSYKKLEDTITKNIAAFAGVAVVLQKTKQLMDEGLGIQRAEQALIGFTGSAAEAERVMLAVQEAAGGVLTEFEASQSAARLFSMGLATTADEAADLTKMATTLGAAMGKGPNQAFEEFALLLANQSIPRLDTFGISAGAVRTRIAELKKETAGLTSEQAFMQAVMEEGGTSLDKLAESGFDASNSVEKFDARVRQIGESFKVFLAEGLTPYFDIIDGAIERSDNFANSLQDNATWMDFFNQALVSGQPLIQAAGTATGEMVRHNNDAAVATREAADAVASFDTALLNYNQATSQTVEVTEDAAIAFDDLNTSVGGFAEKFRKQIEFFEAGGGVIQQQLNAMYAAVDKGEQIDPQLFNDLQVQAILLEDTINGVDFEETAQKIATQLGIPLEEAKQKALEARIVLQSLGGTAVFSVDVNVGGIDQARRELRAIGDMANAAGQGGGVSGGRAAGGPVTSGNTYLVGERGPELFTPNTSGQIINNEDTAAMMNGGGGETELSDSTINRLAKAITRAQSAQ